LGSRALIEVSVGVVSISPFMEVSADMGPCIEMLRQRSIRHNDRSSVRIVARDYASWVSTSIAPQQRLLERPQIAKRRNSRPGR
jgi:hypothetical protein